MDLITSDRMMTVYEELNNSYDLIMNLIKDCLAKDLCLLDKSLASLKLALQRTDELKNLFLQENLCFDNEESSAKEVVYLTIIEIEKKLVRLLASLTNCNGYNEIDYQSLLCSLSLLTLQILSAEEYLVLGVLDLADEEIDDYIKINDTKKALINEIILNIKEDDLAIYDVVPYTRGLSKDIYS